MKNGYYYQQGDCLLKKCGKFGVFNIEHESIPKEAKSTGSNLVLKGESNSHALYGGKFEVLKHKGTTFIHVEEASILDHVKDLVSNQRAEHHAQEIEPGDYFLDVVQEFDHAKQEQRNIID